MTEFKENFHKREFDPRLLIRACQYYIRRLDYHIRNLDHLSQEEIKYSCDRLFEGIFILEEYSNLIYEDIPEDEKMTLERKEIERNKDLYLPGMIQTKGIEYIRNLIAAYTKRSEDNRKTARERIEDEKV